MRIWQWTSIDVNGAGGVETHIREMSAALRERGHEVCVGMRLPVDWKASVQPVVVHTHGDWWPTAAAWKDFHNLNIKSLVQVLHGTTFGRLRACGDWFSRSAWRGALREWRMLRRADAVIAVSHTAWREAVRYYGLSRHLPYAIIPNAVQSNLFSPIETLTDAPRIAFVGRAEDPVKNVDLLLAACDQVVETVPGFELWAAPGIFAHSRTYVRNQGQLDSAGVARVLRQCRALVLCSKYEGDPLVLREAMAMGLPVIVSDLPQLREVVGSSVNNNYLIINSSSPTISLVESLSQVLTVSKSNWRSGFSSAAPSRSWTFAAAEWTQFFSSQLNKKMSGRLDRNDMMR